LALVWLVLLLLLTLPLLLLFLNLRIAPTQKIMFVAQFNISLQLRGMWRQLQHDLCR
jgi:hypothetical protein